MHLPHNVTSTNKLPLNVNLWNRRPPRILFDLFADGVVGQDIHVLEVTQAVRLQQHDHEAREATLRHLFAALHEHNHVVLVDPGVELFV